MTIYKVFKAIYPIKIFQNDVLVYNMSLNLFLTYSYIPRILNLSMVLTMMTEVAEIPAR